MSALNIGIWSISGLQPRWFYPEPNLLDALYLKCWTISYADCKARILLIQGFYVTTMLLTAFKFSQVAST
jgi:hypothetical protein